MHALPWSTDIDFARLESTNNNLDRDSQRLVSNAGWGGTSYPVLPAPRLRRSSWNTTKLGTRSGEREIHECCEGEECGRDLRAICPPSDNLNACSTLYPSGHPRVETIQQTG